MSGYAWVTLATNNAYSLGALVLAHSLKKEKTAHKLAVLITPAVSEGMREQLQTVFDVVKVVDVLDSKDEAHLALMKRPDLGITFTKIHCWRLVEFEKCVFLDADTLVVRNCDELFEREEFSAAPDVSWPDCFNSGVFVYRPSVETFNKLLQFAVENRSFDGGDQGLLNQYFSDWATEDIKKHLPFVYNLTSVAAYSYIPAFKHFGAETRIVHFIGTGKPWLQQLDVATKTVTPASGSEHLAPLLQQWWNLFCEKVHPNLDKNLESSNDGMSHSPVEACSNSLPIALIDESQTPQLIEPCVPYREKDDFRQCNLPYQPFNVKGSSGELLNVEFLLASVVPPTAAEVSLDEQQRLEEKSEEENKNEWRNEEKENEEKKATLEINSHGYQDKNFYPNIFAIQEPEKFEEKKEEDLLKEEEQEKQEELLLPPKDPFDYNCFFPDENCIHNYLERNLETYRLFENHHHHHHHQHEDNKNNNETNISISEQNHEESIPPLPRFLTLPEDDRRQSGNIETYPSEEDHCKTVPPAKELPSEKDGHFSEKPNPHKELVREDFQTEPFVEKRELTKSKSMPYLHCDVTTESQPPMRSIWKSQPDVNIDTSKKYSMPKLKPILPKQNSFNKSVPLAIPKVTHYTEFLMSSEYKDPVDLPKDKVGFVEMHILKEAKLRRSKSEVDIRSKFGPLPYNLTPEVEKPVTKKIPFRHLDNEFYDLTQCKRQMGNKPKPKDADRKKENVPSLPALKPIVPGKNKTSTLIKKRKSKELSPGNGGREKTSKRESKLVREHRREPKITTRKSNELDEILNRLREFSKNYQHFFGKVPETMKKVVKCKNTSVQASDQSDAECKTSESFETVKSPTSTMSKETQTPKEENRSSAIESSGFREFRKYVKVQKETSQKGLINIQDLCAKSSKGEREVTKSYTSEAKKNRIENGNDYLTEISNNTRIRREENADPGEEYNAMKAECASALLKKDHSSCHSLFVLGENDDENTESPKSADSRQNSMKCNGIIEGGEYSTKAIPFNFALQRQSKEAEKNGETENSALFKFSHFTADSPKASEITTLYSEVQKRQLTSEAYESNEFEDNKTFSAYFENRQVNPERSLKPSEDCLISSDGKESFFLFNACKNLNEKNDITRTSEILVSTDFNKSNRSIDSESHPKDDSNKQQIEINNSINAESFNVKGSSEVSESDIRLKDHLTPSLEKKEGKIKNSNIRKKPEGDLEMRNGTHDEIRNRTLNGETVAKNLAPVSPAVSKKKQTDGFLPNGNFNVNECFEERNTQPDIPTFQKAANIRKVSSTFPSGTEKVDTEEPKNPSEVLCVPDFDTPRSSRAPLLSSKTSTDEKPQTPTPPIFPRSTLQKARESRTSPRKTSANGFKNGKISESRFEIFSNNSPDGTIRFEGKKSSDNKSEKKSSPLSSPDRGNPQNPQPESLEDTKSPSGIAGAIAQLSLEAGSAQSPESAATSAAQQEYLRRQNWETGNMDYMGRDSFDNIWSKICQTIEAKELEEVVGDKTKNLTKETEGKKPEEASSAACPASLPPILQKCPEYIDTLPGEPASGPVEDDEIIFSKPENKQSCLTNIVEEEEVGTESSGSCIPAAVTGSVKLSDILHSKAPVVDDGHSHTGISLESEKPQDMIKIEGTETHTSKKNEQGAEVIPGGENKNLLETLPSLSVSAKPTDVMSQPMKAPPDLKPQPADLQSEKPQKEIGKPDCQTVAIFQPSIQSPKSSSSDSQKQFETPARDEKSEANLKSKEENCKTVALPPSSVSPKAPHSGKKNKKRSKGNKPEGKPEVALEPIPLPAPDSPTVAPPQELPSQTLGSDSSNYEGKQKKGVFTKILEMVGVAPKEKNENEISKSVFYDVEGGPASKQLKEVPEKQESNENEKPSVVDTKPSLSDTLQPKKAEQDIALAADSPTTKEFSKPEESVSEFIPDPATGVIGQEIKEPNEAQEKTLDTKSETFKDPKEIEKINVLEVKEMNEGNQEKSDQQFMPKPERNSSPKELKHPDDPTQASAAKRKSPSPLLTIPQKPPETEVTTPTPPPYSDVPPRRNSSLLAVDDSILETPPVPEPFKEGIDEAVKGKVSTEIDDIIGKAKSEVESLLQDRRSMEKEMGEDVDLINTMKLMLGEEQPAKAAVEEGVEELKVTSEEERKRPKSSKSSKLSDQILKAIPPPRRKAISEASASTSGTPKASPAPEQKSSGDSKGKASKPSSIPVPPPRSRGKPTQPAPSKSKGKK